MGLPDLTEPRHWPFVRSGALAPSLPMHRDKIKRERVKGKAACLFPVILASESLETDCYWAL